MSELVPSGRQLRKLNHKGDEGKPLWTFVSFVVISFSSRVTLRLTRGESPES